MKKMMNLLVVCALMILVNTVASASVTDPYQVLRKVFIAEDSGVEIYIPVEYEKAKGTIEFTDLGDQFTQGKGIVELNGTYYPMPEPEFLKMLEEEAKAEHEGNVDKAFDILTQMNGSKLFYIYGIDGDRKVEDLKQNLIAENVTEDMTQEEIAKATEEIQKIEFIEIGSLEGFTYYLEMANAGKNPELPDYEKAYLDEYIALSGNSDMLLKQIWLIGGVKLTVPVDLAEKGKMIRFETKDVAGNPVKSEELFSGHAVTMINMWATWCGPCKRELPELEKMNQSLAEKNCQIIGIVTDADSEELIAEAVEILKERGVSYVNVAPFEGMEEMLPMNAYPTTYFVDETGALVGEPVVGAYLEQYPEVIEAILKEMK